MLTVSDIVKIAINAPPVDPEFRIQKLQEEPNLSNFAIAMMWREVFTKNMAALVQDVYLAPFQQPEPQQGVEAQIEGMEIRPIADGDFHQNNGQAGY